MWEILFSFSKSRASLLRNPDSRSKHRARTAVYKLGGWKLWTVIDAT
jgi:hypothetical protein